MTEFVLYREPELLESGKHRNLRLTDLADYSTFTGLHSTLLTVTEFGSAALEFPIVFVRESDPAPGTKFEVAPCVILGLAADENLFVDGQRWDARYVPASIRRYPFSVAKLEGMTAPAIVFDKSWRGFSEIEGESLYNAEGKPAQKLTQVVKFLEEFSGAVAQSRAFCARLVELELLQSMTANVKLADGTAYSLNGFYAVDEVKLRELPDAVVLELVRNGMMELLHAHMLSMGTLHLLIERKSRRLAKPA